MPDENWAKYRLIEGRNVVVESLQRGWIGSPKVNGKLRLTGNPYARHYTLLKAWKNVDGSIPNGVPGAFGISRALAAAEAESYNKLRGKLYKGSAALGMTLSTYKQSREMIVNRYASLNVTIEQLFARMHKGRRKGKQVSDLYLEYVFGWAPLLSDIKAACLTVIQQAPESGWLTAKAVEPVQVKLVERNPYIYDERTCEGVVIVQRSTGYTVSNPNLWLVERAGLLNPMAIAWDRVPWSFVVNMFVNTGALVNSVTDFVGLGFSNATTSYTTKTQQFVTRNENWPGGYNRLVGGVTNSKNRIYGATARPPLVLKLPKANWELAAIAASLTSQKIASTQWMRDLTYSRGK